MKTMKFVLYRETPIKNPRVGEAHQPLLATHLGEGTSNFKPMVRGPRCQLARPWQLKLMLFPWYRSQNWAFIIWHSGLNEQVFQQIS